MLFCLRLFPRKLEKKVISNPTILKSKDFMIDILLWYGAQPYHSKRGVFHPFPHASLTTKKARPYHEKKIHFILVLAIETTVLWCV